MRCIILTLAGAGVVALALAAAVVGFGLFNVSAAAGHLPGVSWILHTTYENSVALRAPPAAQVPVLTGDMAAIGARHFDSACRPCHAAPGEDRTATMAAMVPPPPPIEAAAWHWDPRHLFWIVKNGVKMSGMPHWPAELRDDDVWLVVAFLDAARGMQTDDYRTLVDMPQEPDALYAYCASCHGLDGAGRGNRLMPRLDILDRDYIADSLVAFREGTRQSGIMQQAASRLTDAEIADLAGRFSTKPPELPAPAAPAEGVEFPEGLVEQGRTLAFGGTDSRQLPACRACHGPWPSARAQAFPNLAGQRAAYLRSQLALWKQGHRGGTRLANLMHVVAHELDDGQMDALAAFYAAGAPAE